MVHRLGKVVVGGHKLAERVKITFCNLNFISKVYMMQAKYNQEAKADLPISDQQNGD